MLIMIKDLFCIEGVCMMLGVLEFFDYVVEIDVVLVSCLCGVGVVIFGKMNLLIYVGDV